MVGDPKAPAERIWVALEMEPRLLKEALEASVRMLLLHHPPLFQPLHSLRVDRPSTKRLVQAAAGGLAVFAAHTNLDMAPGGVNDALAKHLGLVKTRPLRSLDRGLAKLVTFVPPKHLETVSKALFSAGAGRIGDYRECAFFAPGTGAFLAPEDGRPFVGQAGQREQVEELRLETMVPQAETARVLKALFAAHPYEEPAVDVYPLGQGPAGCGLGRVGNLPSTETGKEFLARAAQCLSATCAQKSGPVPDKVETVAVVGGSGGDLLETAAAAGAQVLVTGEARYHQAEQAGDLGICLLTLGHYQTENVIVKPWARRVASALSDEGLLSEVTPYDRGADPWQPVSAGMKEKESC